MCMTRFVFILLFCLSFCACATRVRTFQSLAALGFERRLAGVESVFLSRRKVDYNWLNEERVHFSKLPENEKTRYLIYRLAVETTLDGERAFQLLDLFFVYSRNNLTLLRSNLAKFPRDDLSRFCQGVGGSLERLNRNLEECERLAKPSP